MEALEKIIDDIAEFGAAGRAPVRMLPYVGIGPKPGNQSFEVESGRFLARRGWGEEWLAYSLSDADGGY